MPHFVDLVRTSEIPAGEARTFEIGGRSVAVFNRDGRFYAIDDLCPHMGASLASGDVDGCIVTCPWHAWRFDIRDGAWCDNPRIRTDSFPLRVVGEMLQIEWTEKITDTVSLAAGSAGCAASSTAAEKVPAVRVPAEAGTGNPGPLLADFQALIRRMYLEKDLARGISGTFMWLMEEVGELATALRSDDRENLAEEFADVLAWLATIANVAGVDLAAAVTRKYGSGCPGCHKLVCLCPDAEKP